MAVLIPKSIQYPFSIEKIRDLKLGQIVSISGRIFACRDRVHRHLFDGGDAPVELKDGAIFHCGPAAVPTGDGWIIRAAGPTTSARHDPYMPRIIEKYQIRLIIGKGGMGAATRQACAAHGCVYLQAVGGAGQLLAARIERVTGVYFAKEFGPSEALWDLSVKDFPAIVSIDAGGRSLYRRVEKSSRAALRRAIKSGAGQP